ncbi:leucyl aminopeptidase [Lagierella sp.]|uniref:leucyl aminopeptidase n=1 Tax=Lagierella sp. TaxID=2849657 RepID=UPI0026382F0E|nr:leucyl aminopeptidase [Lagierella sp.]
MKYTLNENVEAIAKVSFVKDLDSLSNEGSVNENVYLKLGQFKAYTLMNSSNFNLLVVVKDEFEKPKHLIDLGFKISKEVKKFNISSLELSFDEKLEKKVILNIFEGILQAEYEFKDYKTKEEDEEDKELILNLLFKQDLSKSDFEYVENIIDGVNFTRYLVNTPAIDMYPETLANETKKKLESVGVNVKILDKEEIEKLNMKAFLAVAEGSDKEPKFIIMEYLPVKDQTPIGLVGKGLTYDSGGYALKNPKGMATMHGDMAGSGTVIGTIYALAKNKVQKNVIGFVAACENMVSGRSYKNGDIISSMKGTFIEVVNTDAEGRLTLADAIYYAATKTDAQPIIDLATLTGACVIALGEKTTGVVTNDDSLYEKFETSSKNVGEYFWKLPTFDVLRDLLKTKRADITNSTGIYGGAMTAGLFLEHFVEEKKWAHLDIAGPAYADSAYDYIPFGATGVPVKTLYDFVKNY